MEKVEKKEKILAKPKKENSKCPDFDEDCKDVQDHVRCFIGGFITCGDCGRTIFLDPAEGYCPFIQNPN